MRITMTGGTMGWTEVAAELGTQAFLTGLKAAKGRVTKRQYKRLIATTVAQVLALHPDVGEKKARRRAERATGTAPSKKLMKGKGKAKAVAAGLVAGGALKAVASARGRKRSSPPRPARAPAREREPSSSPPPEPGPPISAGAESGESGV